MKKFARIVTLFTVLVFLSAGISGCAQNKKPREPENTVTAAEKSDIPAAPASAQPSQLPTRYQSPNFVVPKNKLDDGFVAGEPLGVPQIKVGATIRSTGGPQPLWDVMKRLANLKGMTVSWANDVDQTVLVDVDIAANDNFNDAIANVLRQADYFHEINGNNVVIRNKVTKVIKIAVPFMRGEYTSTVGGNFLANRDVATGTEGTIKIESQKNKFNIWDDIEKNLNSILKTSSLERKDITSSDDEGDNKNDKKNGKDKESDKDKNNIAPENSVVSTPQFARYTDKDEPSFVLDRSVGLITVTAKPALLNTVEEYLENLKKHLFQQVHIEAKIVEVYLENNSKIGIDWKDVFKNNPTNQLSGTIDFGGGGQVYPHADSFISKVSINSFNFQVLLNALREQGETNVLANPKITVLNGQPALISVGKDVAYVKSVKRDETDSGLGGVRVTFTVEVDNVVQGVALGVMASIVDQDKVMLHLTPITTDIENLAPDGSVIMTQVAQGFIELGLPQVKLREMSTIVEVQDGEMLVIGGLIDSLEHGQDDFIPGLGDIPVIKYLFGTEEKKVRKRELVILLTPKII
jgi:pilus (MSHA type) biogenesis protein MshL